MYGGYKDGISYGYNFADIGLPVIERGYWKLISKQSLEEEIKNHYFDFSLFIFDTDTNNLYLFQIRF
ncbi:MAG TPA: hypothetical protein DHW61_04090 [Lachnoclostridium phytofermentans]|uniref:Uncharacterized protein n=1 Tax=Lachnoclostridium phytofermentans TaxID=66219 RepID=A0A3D2X3M6_9FIRM|nr:hypothetical protein [Lachnoclostridium phytofermentans]